jgi:hypothetical protein
MSQYSDYLCAKAGLHRQAHGGTAPAGTLESPAPAVSSLSSLGCTGSLTLWVLWALGLIGIGRLTCAARQLAGMADRIAAANHSDTHHMAGAFR